MPFIVQLLMMLAGMGGGRLAAKGAGALMSRFGGKAISEFGAKALMAPAAQGASGLEKFLRPATAITPASIGRFSAETAGFLGAMTGAEHFMSGADNDTGPVYSAMQTPMPFERQEGEDLNKVYSEQQLAALRDALDRLGIGDLV